jgi:hypothetical protein
MPMIEEAWEVWSFGGMEFAREVQPGGFSLLPKRQTMVSVDHVLDTNEAYRDYGGTLWGPLPFRAIFNTREDAEAFADLEGTTDTLSGPGWSGTRILVNPDVQYVNGKWFSVDCEFA